MTHVLCFVDAYRLAHATLQDCIRLGPTGSNFSPLVIREFINQETIISEQRYF